MWTDPRFYLMMISAFVVIVLAGFAIDILLGEFKELANNVRAIKQRLEKDDIAIEPEGENDE